VAAGRGGRPGVTLERVLYTADVVYSGVGLPVEGGAVLVSGDTVVAFGKLEAMRLAHPGVRVEHLGLALSPRPVNAHTHLDMTDYPYREASYGEWIGSVIALGRERPGLRGVEAARRGLELIRASGAGAFGDIVARPAVMDMLLERDDLPGVAYWEVLGPNPDDAETIFQATVERVRAWRRLERPGGVRVGLSPHTGHTVSAALVEQLAGFARLEGLPVQIHVAEAPEEAELFQSGTGPAARSMEGFTGRPVRDLIGREPDPGLTAVKHLAELGMLEARPTLVHMVNVTEEDVRIVAAAGCPVVHCLRSNTALGCGTFPWALYARYGVEVGLGTNSVASGGTLSIVDEARAALALHGPAAPWRSVVRAAVKGGYRALGLKTPVVGRGDPFSSLWTWPAL